MDITIPQPAVQSSVTAPIADGTAPLSTETPVATPPSVDEGGTVIPQEQPPAPPPEPNPTELDLSNKFAALARKEAMIRQREQQLKSQWDEYQNFQKLKSEAPTNPIAYLQAAGLDYRQITDYLLNDNKPTPEQQIQKLQAEIEAERQQRQQQESQRIIDDHKWQIQQHVTSDPDKYELINANQAHELVYDTIFAYWQQTKTMLPIEEAANHVESELEKQAKRLLGLKKLSQRQETPPPQATLPVETPPPVSPPQAAPAQPPRTLSNESTAGAEPPQPGWLSHEESLKRAAALLKWN